MTVGIAAVADYDNSIIFATDQMLSIGMRTVDLPLVVKALSIHKRWFVVYAGTVTLVPPVLQKVREALSAVADASVGEVADTFVRVYREERAKLAEQSVLSPFGLDMQMFVSHLINNQGAGLADMKRRIQDFDFDCEFLVGGFDPNGKAHIFTVTPPGVESHYDAIGFWSIGSGADAALSNLMFRRLHSVMPLKQSLYHVAEAKFMSECSMGVGKNSLFMRVTSDGHGEMLQSESVIKLRQLWEAEGQPPIPANLDARVPDFKAWEEVRKLGAKSSSESGPAQPSDSQTSEGQP